MRSEMDLVWQNPIHRTVTTAHICVRIIVYNCRTQHSMEKFWLFSLLTTRHASQLRYCLLEGMGAEDNAQLLMSIQHYDQYKSNPYGTLNMCAFSLAGRLLTELWMWTLTAQRRRSGASHTPPRHRVHDMKMDSCSLRARRGLGYDKMHTTQSKPSSSGVSLRTTVQRHRCNGSDV